MDLSLFFVSFLFLYVFAADLTSYCRCVCYLCSGTDVGAMVRWQLVDVSTVLLRRPTSRRGGKTLVRSSTGMDSNGVELSWLFVFEIVAFPSQGRIEAPYRRSEAL